MFSAANKNAPAAASRVEHRNARMRDIASDGFVEGAQQLRPFSTNNDLFGEAPDVEVIGD